MSVAQERLSRSVPRFSASTPSAAIPTITLGSGVPMPSPHPSAIGGRMADAALRRFLMQCFNLAQFWDCRAKNLESSSRRVGRSSIRPRWHHPEPHVAEQPRGTPGYRDAFAKAFPGEPESRRSLVEIENLLREKSVGASREIAIPRPGRSSDCKTKDLATYCLPQRRSRCWTLLTDL